MIARARRSFLVIATRVAIIIAGAAVSPAEADDDARVAALEARIAKLEAEQTHADRAIQQSHAIDAAIADAEKRGPFSAGEPLTAVYDNGLKIGTADGKYLISPFVEFQFRNVTNYTAGDDNTGAGDDNNDSLTNGFEARRLKFGVRGNVLGKELTYVFRFTVDRSTGDTRPDFAFIAYKFADDWAIRIGQSKLNWTREETIADTRQLVAERSLLNQILGGSNSTYVQGVTLIYGNDKKPFRGEIAVTDGDNTSNTSFSDQNNTGNYQDFGVGARVEYKFAGKWAAYEDFTARKTDEPLWVAGAGIDWAEGGDGDVYRMTADIDYENPGGLGVYGAAIYTVADSQSTDSLLDKSVGGLVQIGYLLPNAKDWEIFGRYDLVHLDASVNGEQNFHEATVGVNRYYHGHNAKLTIDAGWYPNGSPEGAGGLGVNAGSDEQIVVRGQFQLIL